MYTHDAAVTIVSEIADLLATTADKRHITRDGDVVRALVMLDRNQLRVVRIANAVGTDDLVSVTVSGPLVSRVLDRHEYMIMAGIDDTADVSVADLAHRLLAALDA